MNLPEFGVKRPVTNLMIFLAVIVLALYSFTRIGIDSMPEIEPPVISVISSYPGASPEDVETKVTEVLENQLATAPGIEKITSSSSDGVSVISVQFIWGANLDEASNDLRDRIDLAKRFLPDIPGEMDNPRIFKFNTANMPVAVVGFTARESYYQLYDLIDQRVGDSLRQLPGIGTVQVHGGGLQRQINVWVDRQRLEGYGFSILDIQNVLRQENIAQPLGNLKSGLTDYLIRLPGEFATPDEMNSVILGKRSGVNIYLKDVARIEDGFQEVSNIARINGRRGLIMMVQKQSGTNTVEVAERVKERLNELKAILPADIEATVIFDSSQDIINSLNSLRRTLQFAILLVILVVWFFLRRFTPSSIIALSIPFSLLISFIYIFLSGKTINTISLSSLAIASGMVVDNAIVVVDNIYRRLQRGNRPAEAAIFGAKEMFLAIAASTLTTVVVFLPMLFISGVVGIMLGELAIIITATLAASLFTAMTFSPMLCSKWMRAENGPGKNRVFLKFYDFSEKQFKRIEEFYAATLARCLRHKKFVIIGFFAAFFLSLALSRFIGSEFAPEEDTGDMRITAQLPIGTRLEETDKVAARIEGILREKVPEAKYYYTRSGAVRGMGRIMGQASGSNVITCGAKLVPKNQRSRSVKEAAQAVRREILAIPGIWRTDISTGSPLGRMITGASGKAVQVEISGYSFEETGALAEKIKEIMENTPGAVDASVSLELNRPELIIEVDREKAAALGLNMYTIANTLQAYIDGSTATKYREKGETYDVLVRLEEPYREKIEDIENLPIMVAASEGAVSFLPLDISAATQAARINQIKLGNIAKISEALGPQYIERKNRQRVVKVGCNNFRRSPGKIAEDIKREMDKLTIPSGLMLEFGGDIEEQQKAFKDLTLMLILSVFLVYMVMAAQFESLSDPFIIMFAIPFTFIGVILGFVATGTTLNMVTFLGVIMLTGIVVNNAIVLISYINILRARGFSMLEAVTNAGRERLRPVLMTTITTLAGLLPLALSRGEGSEVWQPLGITMISGLSVSTFITMLFVPTMYAAFHRKAALKEVKR